MSDGPQSIAVPIVLRRDGGALHYMAYAAEDGPRMLLARGNDGELANSAMALRCLAEDAGLSAPTPPLNLGQSKGIVQGKNWHFFLCSPAALQGEWVYSANGDTGEQKAFFWVESGTFLDEEEWDPRAIRALRFAEGKIAKIPEERLVPLIADADDPIPGMIRSLAAERGADKTICPSEVARAIGGSDETQWRKLMAPIRTYAVAMAHGGEIDIRRKGKVVDPDNFKGIYRISIKPDA